MQVIMVLKFTRPNRALETGCEHGKVVLWPSCVLLGRSRPGLGTTGMNWLSGDDDAKGLELDYGLSPVKGNINME